MDYSLLKSLDQGKIDCLTNETRVLIAVNVVSAILINDCSGFWCKWGSTRRHFYLALPNNFKLNICLKMSLSEYNVIAK